MNRESAAAPQPNQPTPGQAAPNQPDPDQPAAASTAPYTIESVAALRNLVGQEFVAAHWLHVDQQRIQTFAEVTEDRQWIHLDPERARRESPYQATVAHGFFTLSLLSHFINEAIAIRGGALFAVNYGLGKVRFPAPVRVDAEIRARFLLRSLDEVAGGLQATYVATFDLRNSPKPCCVAEWLLRYYTAP